MHFILLALSPKIHFSFLLKQILVPLLNLHISSLQIQLSPQFIFFLCNSRHLSRLTVNLLSLTHSHHHSILLKFSHLNSLFLVHHFPNSLFVLSINHSTFLLNDSHSLMFAIITQNHTHPTLPPIPHLPSLSISLSLTHSDALFHSLFPTLFLFFHSRSLCNSFTSHYP